MMPSTMFNIVSREEWGAQPSKRLRHITQTWRFIIHRSETPDHDPISPHQRARSIQEYHMGKGWCDIGYGLMIGQGGEVLAGRPLWAGGAHASGLNTSSVGVCLLGKREFTKPQMEVLHNLLDWGLPLMGLSRGDVFGHKEFHSCNTDCPGEQIMSFIREYRGDMKPSFRRTERLRRVKNNE